MKRKLQNVLFMAFAVLALFSCSDDTAIPAFETGKIARFLNGDANIATKEASTELIEIPVYINYTSDRPVNIRYELTGDVNAVEDLSTQSGYAVIPSGEKKGLILLKAVDNNDYNEVYNQVKVTITGTDADYELPNDLALGFEQKTIVFEDDECKPLESRNAFEGELSIEDVGYGFVNGTGEVSTIKGECGILYITGDLPNAGARIPTYRLEVFSDNTVVCTPQNYADLAYTYEATGVIENDTMTLDYAFKNPSGATEWVGTNIIKAK